MEVVAKKYPRKRAFIVILTACILMAVVGALFACAYAFLDGFTTPILVMGIVLLIIGVVLTGLMIFSLVRFCRLPENLITYENGILTFPNGEKYRAEEVTSVSCDKANPSYQNMTYDFGFGKIKVFIGSKKITAWYAASPDRVVNRLKQIVYEAKLLSK